MERLEARPTEYRGVHFRSKCEAMFALYLDFVSEGLALISSEKHKSTCPDQWYANTGKLIWKYEPPVRFNSGFQCDFLVCKLNFPTNKLPELEYQFIEYKPCVPTDAYSERFFRRHKEIQANETNFCSSVACIFYGSIFTKNRGIVFENGGSNCNWVEPCEDEMRSYRFDLAVQHG